MKAIFLLLGILVAFFGAYSFLQGLPFVSQLSGVIPAGGAVHYAIITILGILIIILALKKRQMPKLQ